jgi:hypothetical protein
METTVLTGIGNPFAKPDWIALTNQHGGEPSRLAIYRRGSMSQIWTALLEAGVRPASPMPEE